MNSMFDDPLVEIDRRVLTPVYVDGVEINVGRRVVIRPHSGGDIMDIVLAGKVAIVEAIEQDFEDNIQVAVVIDDDPGRDMGFARQPGHRFFFSPSELEPVKDAVN